MADRPDELFLIDGNSLVYRAFFALPESIATSTGFPTNAIFGFASMLVKLLTDNGVKPTVVVWDKGSSGRKELYDDYKGHRPRKPDLLAEQYPHIQPMVEAFGYSNYAVEGYEADDVIATLAEQAKAEGIPVTIVTGDRDAFQLVGDGVRVMATSRGITETKTYEMFVDGRWQPAASGETVEETSPATGEVIGTVPQGDRSDAQRAIAAANRAFEGWSRLTAFEQSEQRLRSSDITRQQHH